MQLFVSGVQNLMLAIEHFIVIFNMLFLD